MPKASAYGDEIWQVDSLSQGADRMFISLKSLKGFSSGGATYHKFAFHTFHAYHRRPKRIRVDYRRLNIPGK
jgi:hypothetical protein